jgi:nicotinamidase-related amidase
MGSWEDILGTADRIAFAKGFATTDRVGFGERPAVLIVDMCRAFVEDEYPTGDSRRGEATVGAIGELLTAARMHAIPVFFTTYAAADFASGWSRWKGTAVKDPSLRTDRAFEIVPSLAPQPGERVIVKTMPSAFFGTVLVSWLTFHAIDTVIVTGMVTSGCIRATVVDAFSHNYRTVIPEECVADRGELSHKVSLFDMHMKYGDVLPLVQVISYLETVGYRRKASGANG